jgi:hypothetical protein
MKRTIIGVAISAVVLYVWGFLYWGLGPYRTMVWKQAKDKDDGAAGQALLEHFPENGTYYVPGFGHDQATIEGLFESGPVAFVHMLSTDGRPMADPSIMIQGFLLNLVVIVLVAVLLRRVCSALPTYFDRVKFVALVGLTAALLIDVGGAVWWQIDWSWKLYQALYDFSAWLVIGAILAKFIEPEPLPTQTP